jgi:hypothetical protein
MREAAPSSYDRLCVFLSTSRSQLRCCATRASPRRAPLRWIHAYATLTSVANALEAKQVMINSTIRRMRLSLGRPLHSPRKRFIKAMRGPRPSIHDGMSEATVYMPRRKVQNKTMGRSA